MTESFESVTNNKNRISSDIISSSRLPLETSNNPRLSTTSSGAGESDCDQQLQLNQLVVAQVHHDPILEMPAVEDKETDSLEVENIKKDDAEVTAMKMTTTNETSEAKNNTESYSIAGATISENESFSLASYEDGLSTTQQSSKPMTAASSEAEIEATTNSTMLPVNHVIQYSPRTASAPNWTPSVQIYNNSASRMIHHDNGEDTLIVTQFEIEEADSKDDNNDDSKNGNDEEEEVEEEQVEPMEVDREHITDLTNDNVNESCHELLTEISSNQRDSFSCPIYPHKQSSMLVTTE